MKQSISKIRYLLFISLLISIFPPADAQDQEHRNISLLFMGDIMGHDEQIWSAENRETHTFSYDEVFYYIKPVISEADLAIANLEVTLAGAPYKGYPQFSSPAALAVACQNAGIDYLVTANNHSADRGKKGIISTINKLDSLGFPHTGTFADTLCRDTLSPLMIHKNGVSLALLNYTFSTNGIVVPGPVVVNMLDKQSITNDVNKAREKNPDLIVVFLHWGVEYDTIPSKSQTDMAEYLQSVGVDLVIGSHPHVIQRMAATENDSTGKKNIVVYSLGNFVSNQRKPKTDGGSMVKVNLAWNGEKYVVADAGYFLTWVYTPIVQYRKKFHILPCSQFENNPGFFDKPEAYSLMKKFQANSRKLLDSQNLDVREYKFDGTQWVLR